MIGKDPVKIPRNTSFGKVYVSSDSDTRHKYQLGTDFTPLFLNKTDEIENRQTRVLEFTLQ